MMERDNKGKFKKGAINPMLGQKMPEWWKEKLRHPKSIKQTQEIIQKRSLKIIGKKRNLEQRQNISNAMKGKKKSEIHKQHLKEYHKLHPRKGFKISEITKQKLKEALKGNTNGKGNKNKIVTQEQREKMSITRRGKPNFKLRGRKLSQERIEKMRLIRLNLIFPTKDSSIEKKLQKQLSIAGIIYEKHKPIMGQPDIFIPSMNLCIFADGCYWHGCHECFGYNNKKKDHWYRDFRIKNELELEGYKVIRIWEHNINEIDFNIINYLKLANMGMLK